MLFWKDSIFILNHPTALTERGYGYRCNCYVDGASICTNSSCDTIAIFLILPIFSKFFYNGNHTLPLIPVKQDNTEHEWIYQQFGSIDILKYDCMPSFYHLLFIYITHIDTALCAVMLCNSLSVDVVSFTYTTLDKTYGSDNEPLQQITYQ